jgi:chitinase
VRTRSNTQRRGRRLVAAAVGLVAAGGALLAPGVGNAATLPSPHVVSTVAAGTSTSAPAGRPAGVALPAHVLTGYWQDFTNGATPLRLSDVPTSYDLVAVAFANADPANPGGVTFAVDPDLASALGGYSADDFTSDVATLHGRGQKVIISVGGQNGTISVTDSASATNFADSVGSLMDTFGFDGVDIDLENGVNPTYLAQALHALAAAHPGAIITLAPQTIDVYNTSGDYFQLALAIKDVLTIMNTQYYNSGTMNGCDGNVYSESTEDFLTALACTALQGGLAPSQVGLGLPASAGGASSGYLDPADVDNALDCLTSATNCGSFTPSTSYPDLGGAMDWSINWDAAGGYAFANTVHPHLAQLP